MEAINAPELMLAALKSHQIIDALLGETLLELLPNGDALELRQLSFMLKVNFGIAFNILPAALLPVFAAVNRIRNRFAHERGANLSEEQARDLLNTIPPTFRHPFDSTLIRGPHYILTRTIALLYVHAEGAVEAIRNHKVASAALSEIIQGYVIPEEEYTPYVREQQEKRDAKIGQAVIDAKRRRREGGQL